MQDPYTVATLLIGAARNYNIPNIYFAIPRILEHNYSQKRFKQLAIAFLLEKILWGSKEVVRERDGIMYHIDTDLFHDWIKLFNKDDLLRAVEAAKELGMEEYKDYFLIYDACRTELEKESPTQTKDWEEISMDKHERLKVQPFIFFSLLRLKVRFRF